MITCEGMPTIASWFSSQNKIDKIIRVPQCQEMLLEIDVWTAFLEKSGFGWSWYIVNTQWKVDTLFLPLNR